MDVAIAIRFVGANLVTYEMLNIMIIETIMPINNRNVANQKKPNGKILAIRQVEATKRQTLITQAS
jgi:hypothetical protein